MKFNFVTHDYEVAIRAIEHHNKVSNEASNFPHIISIEGSSSGAYNISFYDYTPLEMADYLMGMEGKENFIKEATPTVATSSTPPVAEAVHVDSEPIVEAEGETAAEESEDESEDDGNEEDDEEDSDTSKSEKVATTPIKIIRPANSPKSSKKNFKNKKN